MNSIKRKYQILSLALALLMLVTSMDFTVDVHFCKGDYNSFSLKGIAKGCHDMAHKVKMAKCSRYKKMMEQNKKCHLKKEGNCENKKFDFHLDQDQFYSELVTTANDLSKEFIYAFSSVFLIKNTLPITKLFVTSRYKPPLIFKDLSVLYETFLI